MRAHTQISMSPDMLSMLPSTAPPLLHPGPMTFPEPSVIFHEGRFDVEVAHNGGKKHIYLTWYLRPLIR